MFVVSTFTDVKNTVIWLLAEGIMKADVPVMYWDHAGTKLRYAPNS